MYNKRKECILPNNIPINDISQQFNDYFSSKICQNNLLINNCQPCHSESYPTISTMTEFQLLSSSDVKKLVLSCFAKSCSLDPLPTFIFRFLDEIIDG